MTIPATFGSLDATLKQTDGGRNLLASSPGPISDAFLLDRSPVSVIVGPQGSAKTTTCTKRALLRTTRMPPWANGVRRYTLGIFRQTYRQLWDSTIPSWLAVLPKKAENAEWSGSSPNPATHVVKWRDLWGECELHALFRGFDESADPNSMRGSQFTDVWLNELDTLPEDLFVWLVGRVGRNPVETVLRRPGWLFGDMNAPDVLNWTYRDFFEDPKPGYTLYRQPGGRETGAENLDVVGPDYYARQASINAHRPWWVRRMVDNRPGFSRDADLVYPEYDDDTMRASAPLEVYPELPVIVGSDAGGTTHAAAILQFAYGQCRVLAEVIPPRGGATELGEAVADVLAQPRFKNCEIVAVCDPAAKAAEDTKDGSDRKRLEKAMGVKVDLAPSNDPNERHAWLRAFMKVVGGKPMFLLDPSIKSIRRGLNQTYAFRKARGTNERQAVVKTPDSHPVEGLEYGCSKSGASATLRRVKDRERARSDRKAAPRERFNPLRRG